MPKAAPPPLGLKSPLIAAFATYTRINRYRIEHVSAERHRAVAKAKNFPQSGRDGLRYAAQVPEDAFSAKPIVALSANNWPIVPNHNPRILAAIDSAVPGSFQAAECGTFSRRTSGIKDESSLGI